MTSSPEAFTLLAELSLALAGFTGVAASLGGRDREFREIERIRMIAIMQFSAISLGPALMAIALLDAGVVSDRAYGVTIFATLCALIATYLYQFPRVRRLFKDGESSTTKGFLGIALLFFGCLAALYGWALFFERTSWPLVVGISLQLMWGLWSFARLLLRAR
jgi:hypothetical protein